MRKPWFMREARSQQALNQNQKNKSSTKRDHSHFVEQSSLHLISKKSDKLQSLTGKLTKMQQFYQVMNSGNYSTAVIRCYEHNNQLILYCIDDHKLLCPNCMYKRDTEENKGRGSHQRVSSQRRDEKDKVEEGKHARHEVKQINKAVSQITNDVKSWSFEVKQLISDIINCRSEWQSFRKSFESAKSSLVTELDKQYDKAQKHLSKMFMQAKKELEDMCDPLSKNIQIIISSYKTLTNLLIPNRYPIMCFKHSWLEKMREFFKNQIPTKIQDINAIAWARSFQTQGKQVVKKFTKRRFRIEQDQ